MGTAPGPWSGPGSAPGAEEFVVGFDAEPSRQRVERYRRFLRSRIISLGITIVVLIVLAVWQPRYVANPVAVVGYVVIIAAGLAWIGVTFALYRRSRIPLATLGEGVALRVDRRGVTLSGQAVGWDQITAFAARPGGWGFSPVLQIERRDGSAVRLPLDQLQTHPASIDSAARAYSGGRFGVDLSELDT